MSAEEKDQHEFRRLCTEGRASVVLNYDFFKSREVIAELSTALAGYALTDQFYEEYELALCEYFEVRDIALDEDESDAEDFFHDENEFSRFMSWFCTYYTSSEGARTFPEFYLAEKDKSLSALEREILQSYCSSYPGLYEVQQVMPGEGLELKNIMNDQTFFVHDAYFSRTLCKWDLVYGGLLLVKDLYFLSGFDPIIIPPRLKTEIEDSVDSIYRRVGATASTLKDFFRQNSPEIFALVESAVRNFHKRAHLKNADGDVLFFVKLYYQIKDQKKFLEKISSLPFFVQDRIKEASGGDVEKAEFIWIRSESTRKKKLEGMPQGILLVEGAALKARCNSLERAERLKSLLAGELGDILKLKTLIYEKPEEQLYDPNWIGSYRGEPLRNLSEDTAVLKEISMRHYENWIDEKIPALGNLSPREAMGSPQSRQNLVNLLKELENQNERAVRKGLKNADILGFPAEMIRRELGL